MGKRTEPTMPGKMNQGRTDGCLPKSTRSLEIIDCQKFIIISIAAYAATTNNAEIKPCKNFIVCSRIISLHL